MGYETKVYIVKMCDRQKTNAPRDITPEEYKTIFKEGVGLNSALLNESGRNFEDPVWKEKFEKWWNFENTHCVWGQIVAMLGMCNIGVVGESNPTGYKGYIPYILPDGDNSVIEDCYGSPLGVHTVDDYLEAVKEASRDSDYRRWPMLIVMLEEFVKNKEQWGDDIRVLTYGH